MSRFFFSMALSSLVPALQNSEDQNSQFQSLEQVKRRPAHLMALLQHVALQFEPGPLVRIQREGAEEE